jgi:16S rRNA (cytosine1402-N4)-methyltransferase
MNAASDDAATVARGGHTPVMLHEVLAALHPRDGAIYVDGTFGAGGYASALLRSATCTVWGIDRDPQAVAAAAALVRRFEGRLAVIAGRFGAMDALLGAHGVTAVDGVTLDLGVSSMQLDEPARGFSFRADGPLDMRMEGAAGERSAADILRNIPESELADVLFRYGEERKARRIAHAIVTARQSAPIERTGQLAEIVRKALGRAAPGGAAGKGRGIDPATRTFQALRILVNDELGEIERGLATAERLLAPGGRLAVVAFHSLEDRLVKSLLRTRSGEAPHASRHLPGPAPSAGRAPSFRLLFRGAQRPGPAECAANPRARSARLRAAERTAAPVWAPQEGTA